MSEKKILRLNVCGIYFDAIKDKSKPKEYRLAEKWENRLSGKVFDEVHVFRGYPKRGDETKILRRKWNGYVIEEITHPHFGAKQVRVLAIDVSELP